MPDVVVRATVDQSTPDEPTAVLVVGAHDSGKMALIRALLGGSHRGTGVPHLPPVSPATYLVMRYGPAAAAQAYLPGCRLPQPYSSVDGDMLARPPRRVVVTSTHPLLRHCALVATPCSLRLGVAGGLVLAEAAERGGAVLFVAPANQPLTRSELDLLAELATREITVFFVIVARSDTADDDLDLALESHQAAVVSYAPTLAEAHWFTVDPAVGDTVFLRRALTDWADAEALHRAGANPPVLAGTGAIHLHAGAAESGWSTALDRWLRASTRAVSQRLAIEVAGVHLRCVQDIVFGGGCAGLSENLDHELHAFSQLATAESDTAVASIVHDVLLRILPTTPTEDIRRRVCAAVRRGLDADADGGELARVLLVTGAAGLAVLPGAETLEALPGYATYVPSPILPPVGLAVAGGCYHLWGDPANAEVSKARSWLQQVTRAIELELPREIGRRFEAVHRSLGGLISESVDHGMLLA